MLERYAVLSGITLAVVLGISAVSYLGTNGAPTYSQAAVAQPIQTVQEQQAISTNRADSQPGEDTRIGENETEIVETVDNINELPTAVQ